tara:strand:+ start:861 stop:2729 length:1869 start_codon:yes stop_codon:yes gene_type:complete
MKTNNNSKIFITEIFVLAFLIFVGKWWVSFTFFPEEDNILKIIHDSHSDSYMYFHYIKTLSDLSFNNIFHPEYSANSLKLIPIGSVFLHSFFYKIFGFFGFIFLELFSIFVFLIIFFLIFKQLKISNQSAILLSFVMFVLPLLLFKINFINLDEINTFASNFYNLRFPRPLIAQLYLFLYIYILIIALNDDIFKFKYTISIGILLGLTFSSFFFIFLLQLISLLIILIYNYKLNLIHKIKENNKKIILTTIIFLFLISPFIYLLINTNESYTQRLGLFNISFENKIFLIKHYLYKLFRPKIFLLYFLIGIFYFVVKNKFFHHKKFIDVFLILFLSSIISPIIFIILSNKISFLYHFNNLVVITSIILLIFMSLIFVLKLINFLENKKYYLPLNLTIIFILLIFYHFSETFVGYKNLKEDQGRLERNQIISLIKNNSNINIKYLNLLTFDTQLMSWAVLNDVKFLKILDGTYSVKEDTTTENDLIEVFKFLSLDKKDFKNFLKNKKIGYRYINHDARMIFWQKYQANSLFTFKNSKNFEKNILSFIKNSSPFYAHQFAIPNDEFLRLLNKFEKIKENLNFEPQIVIIDNSHKLLNKAKLNMKNYCEYFIGEKYKVFAINEVCE